MQAVERPLAPSDVVVEPSEVAARVPARRVAMAVTRPGGGAEVAGRGGAALVAGRSRALGVGRAGPGGERKTAARGTPGAGGVAHVRPRTLGSPFYPFYHVRTSGFDINPRSLWRLGRGRPC